MYGVQNIHNWRNLIVFMIFTTCLAQPYLSHGVDPYLSHGVDPYLSHGVDPYPSYGVDKKRIRTTQKLIFTKFQEKAVLMMMFTSFCAKCDVNVFSKSRTHSVSWLQV